MTKAKRKRLVEKMERSLLTSEEIDERAKEKKETERLAEAEREATRQRMAESEKMKRLTAVELEAKRKRLEENRKRLAEK